MPIRYRALRKVPRGAAEPGAPWDNGSGGGLGWLTALATGTRAPCAARQVGLHLLGGRELRTTPDKEKDMFGRDRLRPGMMVHTSDGQKLGKILELRTDHFIIEKGLIFKKEYTCDYGLVSDVRGEDVIITRAFGDIGKEHRRDDDAFGGARTDSTGDLNIPVVEEELDVVKREREAGAVRIHKDVITEEKTMTVPVTRERVRVERVPVSGGDVRAADAEIGSEDITVPVREEEVEVRKRPVVREEVRVRKERTEEPRMIAETLRKERVDVEGEEEGLPRTDRSDTDYDPNTRY